MEHGTFAILATLFLTTATPLGTGFQFTPTKRIEHEYIPGGGHFRNLWVGMCRWDPGTLNLYQS